MAVSSVATMSTTKSLSATVVTFTVASAAPTLVAWAELNASVGVVWWTWKNEPATAALAILPESVTATVCEPVAGAISPHSSTRQAPLTEFLLPRKVIATLLYVIPVTVCASDNIPTPTVR